jgi:hypothetical protein
MTVTGRVYDFPFRTPDEADVFYAKLLVQLQAASKPVQSDE